MKILYNGFWLSLVFSLLIGSFVWAQTFHIPDTGDAAEGQCNPHSYTDLENGIVRDDITGLEWMKASAPGTYAWQQALDYVDELNDNETFGYTDWRLPTVEELSSIVDAGRYDPVIDPVFDDTVADYYWSSTSFPPLGMFRDRVWYVTFQNGYVTIGMKNESKYVRAVRGGPYGPFGYFVDNGDGTVTDEGTGLMWQRCTSGKLWDEENDNCTGSADGMEWWNTSNYVDGLNAEIYLGYADWRLPTRNELQTLVDYSTAYTATAFPDMQVDCAENYYWVSTAADVTMHGDAWFVDFSHGGVYNNYKGFTNYVRAVRGGSCRSSGDWCLEDGDCTDNSTPYCDDGTNACVECLSAANCPNDGNFCTGDAVCTDGACGFAGDPCSGDTPVCDETGNQCVECLSDDNCTDDGNFCTGDAVCTDGVCGFAGDPCDGNAEHPYCDDTLNTCRAEWDLDGDGNVNKDDSKILKFQQKEEKVDLKDRHKAEKAALKAAYCEQCCDAEWDLNDDCAVDKTDSKLLKARQKEEKMELKDRQKAEKKEMKTALK